MSTPWDLRGVMLVVVLALAGCTSSESSDGTDGSAVDPPSTEEPTTDPPSTDPPATDPPATDPPSTDPATTASCDPDVLLATVSDLFPENELWNPVDVVVAACQNGYAQVFVVVDQRTCPEETPVCLENEQAFLQDVGGAWQYIDSGTGIECPDEHIADACEALGLNP